MVQAIVERRKGKLLLTKQLNGKDPNYFGTTMVYMDDVDGMVSGAATQLVILCVLLFKSLKQNPV